MANKVSVMSPNKEGEHNKSRSDKTRQSIKFLESLLLFPPRRWFFVPQKMEIPRMKSEEINWLKLWCLASKYSVSGDCPPRWGLRTEKLRVKAMGHKISFYYIILLFFFCLSSAGFQQHHYGGDLTTLTRITGTSHCSEKNDEQYNECEVTKCDVLLEVWKSRFTRETVETRAYPLCFQVTPFLFYRNSSSTLNLVTVQSILRTLTTTLQKSMRMESRGVMQT